MLLEILHPEVANRDCEQCRIFDYHEDGELKGKMQVGSNGQPLKRPAGTYPPCKRSSSSCPKGTYENPVQLSEKNRRAWQFFRRCRLTGRWPDDEIVIETGLVLSEVYELVERIQRQNDFFELMKAMRP